MFDDHNISSFKLIPENINSKITTKPPVQKYMKKE